MADLIASKSRKTEGASRKTFKYRVSCKCRSWLMNSDSLPELDAVFNCRNCKKAYPLSDLIISEV